MVKHDESFSILRAQKIVCERDSGGDGSHELLQVVVRLVEGTVWIMRSGIAENDLRVAETIHCCSGRGNDVEVRGCDKAGDREADGRGGRCRLEATPTVAVRREFSNGGSVIVGSEPGKPGCVVEASGGGKDGRHWGGRKV